MRRPLGLIFVVVAAAACSAPASARADVFILKSGGRIEGELIGREGARYRIKTNLGGELTLDHSRVARIDRRADRHEQYEQLRPTYADTAQGQWALAEWCREQRLTENRKKHLSRVLKHEPDHAEARRALGYSRRDGVWKTHEQIMLDRGLVRYQGVWLTPNEVELRENNRKHKQAENAWFGKLKRFRKWLDNPERAESAAESIRTIDDPYALRALDARRVEEANPAARVLYIEALSMIGNPAALSSLADVVLHDPVEEVRLTALDYLVEHDRPEVTGLFAAKLGSKDNQIVNRAAIGLGQLNDTSAVPALIEALVTTHKFRIQQGGQPGSISTTMSQTGSGSATPGGLSGGAGGPGAGLSVGGKSFIVRRHLQNRDVLDALVTLSGVNYFYDQKRWKYWLNSQRVDETLNARRD